jgi:hypothetical protein
MRKVLISGVLISLLVSLALGGCTKEPPKPATQQQISTSSFPMGVGREGEAEVTPTIVPKNMDPEDFVKRYYNLVTKKKYEEAFAIAPTERRAKDTTENFAATMESMPIQSYKILDPVKPDENSLQLPVELQLGGMAQGSTWISTWYFVKADKGWEAQKTVSMPSQ